MAEGRDVSGTGGNVRAVAARTGGAVIEGIALRGFRFVLAAVGHVLIRRVLGPDAFGVYLVAQIALEITAALASLGMGQAILRYLPIARRSRSGGEARRLLRLAFAVQLAGWVVAFALVRASGSPLARFLGSEDAYRAVTVAVALLGTRLLFDLACQVRFAGLDVRSVTRATVLWQLVFLAALLVSATRGYGVTGVLVATGIANAVGTASILGRLREPGQEDETGDGPGVAASRVLRYGLSFAFIGLFYNVVWRASETVLISHYWGAREAGWFGAAYSLPQLVLDFVPGAIWPIVMASYVTVFALDRERALGMVEHYHKLLFAVGMPLALSGMVLGDRALVIAYGEAYAEGAALAPIFFALGCLAFFGTPLSMTLYVLERSGTNLMVWLGAAIVNVGLDLVLIPIDWRLAVWGIVVAILAMPPVLAILVRRAGVAVVVPWPFLARMLAASSPLALLIPFRAAVDSVAALAIAGLGAVFLLALGLFLVRPFRLDEASLVALLPGGLRRAAEFFGRGIAT